MKKIFLLSFNMKIAILRRNGFGDLICTQPLIKSLQKKYPNAEISLFIEQGNDELTKYICPDISINVLPQGNKYLSIVKTALKFRKKNFDIAISAKPSPMKLNNLFLWLLGAKKRYAVVTDQKWHSKLVNYPVNQEIIKGYHQALKILRTFSPNVQSLSFDLFPEITLHNTSTSIFSEEPLILFSVSNNRKHSLINNEKLNLIAGKISEKYPTARFIISAFPNDMYLAEDLTSRIGDNSQIVMCNSLNSFLALLNNMTLIVVGDGGICHLSAALKKKIVALYGVTKPENWSPLASEDMCITLYDPENVNNIALAKITDAIFSLLEK
ncbi:MULTISPECIES: glycosyltransferase family 9 protein [Xenorhabdus]|uniref:glycosyltransferase family 9 protein n=1 Tax=Xenorhabdus TaxID=626 RepID=UPI0006485D9A|nr:MULTISPECIES: glycosyltransferase family 9 protein [Xenorhabdus]MBC8946770.1 glycosyl transferase, family 9 [Xenorhabdus indica]